MGVNLMFWERILIIVTFFVCSCANISVAFKDSTSKYVSPNDYGLREAKTGVERYWALYNAHSEAIRHGKEVSYKGISDINIAIPKDAKWIPLSANTDFGGITITVENHYKDMSLFSMVNRGLPIEIDQFLLDNGDFRRYDMINKGSVLLILKDEKPWVENRKGYDYGATRNDILLLKNGFAQNKAIMPWGDTKTTTPTCHFIICEGGKKVVKNLTLKRSESSTHKTMLITIEGQNDVLVDNVTLLTPDNDQLFGDSAISIVNCTNITVKNVTIDGTYSQKDKFGYGIAMNNVWNIKFVRLVADGKWGVFGTNNINNAQLQDCDLNRFDIHCYGRDVFMTNCRFHDLYNQFSSVYGTIRYERCSFDDFIPYLTEPTYNCYTPFTLVFKDCSLILTKKYGYSALCAMGSDESEENIRPELSSIAWPNVRIDGLKVSSSESLPEFHVFYVSGSGKESRVISNINLVTIKRLDMSNGTRLKLVNRNIKTKREIVFTIK